MAKIRSDRGSDGIDLMVDRPELLSGGSDQKFRQLIFDTIAFSTQMKAVIDGHAGIANLSSPQYLVLTSIMHLSEAQEVNIKTISDHLHISGSFVTISVSALVQMGLVDKTEDKSDRRRVCLKETSAAAELVSRITDIQNRVNSVMFESLTRDEFEMFSSVVARLLPFAGSAVKLQSHLATSARAAQ